MALKFNPLTASLDLVSSGFVKNNGTSTDKAITRFDGTTGKIIQNSKAQVQDGGAVESQGFVTNKIVTDSISIGNNEVMLTTAFSLETNGEIIIESDGELVLV